MKNIITEYNGIRKGFTLVEVMIAVGIFSLVIAGTINVYIICQKVWHSTSLKMQTTQAGSLAIAKMVYGLGTNNGLRAAAHIDVVAAHGYYYPAVDDKYPPAANTNVHGLITNSPNGSWRIISSNSFDGIKWIDYNAIASNIVFWPDISSSSSRQLIGNYVSSAMASTNAGNGIFITITVSRTDGQFNSSNEVSTFVKMRNN